MALPGSAHVTDGLAPVSQHVRPSLTLVPAGPEQADDPAVLPPRRRQRSRASNNAETVALVVAARAGDADAWAGLIERFGASLWLIARNCGIDAAEANDVVQTTWERLLHHLDRIREPERLVGWLAITARREAVRVAQARSRRIPSGDLREGIEDAGSSVRLPEDELLRTERQHEVLRGVDGLKPACRRLFELLSADPPLSYAEIALMTGMKIGSIGPTRARCLECLRRQLPALAS